jgi:hypothetical protein
LSGGATIDGIVLNNNDRVLVRRQTTAIDNGIYVVNTSGAWTRASDFTTGSDTLRPGVTVTVQEGTNMAGVTLYCSNTGTISIGSTNSTFERVVGGSGYVSIWSATNHDGRANANASSGGTAIGAFSAASTDGTAMGYFANTTAGGSVAYGYAASATGTNSIAVGVTANTTGTGGAVSVGYAARTNTGSIAIGQRAGFSAANTFTTTVGHFAGETNQGGNAVAIGAFAGRSNQAANSIIINATGSNLNQTTANSLTIKPIRAATAANVLYYDNSSGEVTHAAFAFPTYTIAGKPGSGSVGQVISISNSVPAGLLAYWDGTNNRWSYVYDNSAV